MKVELDRKRDRVLKAASECFVQYGFRRTAMDDIAKNAGISRAALYLIFQNKEDIFRTLSEKLHSDAITRAQTALESEGSFVNRLIAAFEGKDLELLELVKNSPHGGELVDLSNAIGADIFQAAKNRFQELLTQAIRSANDSGEIVLSHGGFDAEQCAVLLIACVIGIKKSSSSIAEYRQRLTHLISVFGMALKP
jgi:AcrR family transcriptional regulator